MVSMSSIMKIIQYFLPRDASIVNIQSENITEEEEVAVVHGDFNADGQRKILAVYARKGKKYLMGLKRDKRGWNSSFYKELAYRDITYFEITHLEQTNKCEIIVGGPGKGSDKQELRVLEWRGEEVIKVGRTMTFDKLDIKTIEGQEALILWHETGQEIYDITIYTYQNGKLQEMPQLEEAYAPYMIAYYETLKTMYPEEEIYTKYYKELQEKWGSRDKAPKLTLLAGYTAYLEEQEADVFLLGKKMEEYIHKLQLIITSDKKKYRYLINLDVDKVYDYQIRIGKFFESEAEQVFIKVNAHTPLKASKAWIIGLENNAVKFYLNEEVYYLDEDFKTGMYMSTEDEEGIEMRGEVFILDLNLDEHYILCVKHRVWSEKNKCLLGYMVRWLRGQINEFRCYKTYIMVEKGG